MVEEVNMMFTEEMAQRIEFPPRDQLTAQSKIPIVGGGCG
jgi:hypothetical protein